MLIDTSHVCHWPPPIFSQPNPTNTTVALREAQWRSFHMSIQRLSSFRPGHLSTSDINKAHIKGVLSPSLVLWECQNQTGSETTEPDVSEQIKKWGTQEEEANEPSNQAPCDRHMEPKFGELWESQLYKELNSYFYKHRMKEASGSSNG